MEMEHINENLIKVVIDAEDLEKRGITFLDLVSGQEYIERFFYSILEEVDIDRHFRESEAVTFQVMPMQDGIELYISRNNFEDSDESWTDELTNHLFDSKKKTYETSNQSEPEKTVDMSDEKQAKDDNDKVGRDEVVKFEQLEDVLNMARDLRDVDVTSNLYYLDNHYYLVLSEVSEDISEFEFKQVLMKIREYGFEWNGSENYLVEHGKVIRTEDTIPFFAENF